MKRSEEDFGNQHLSSLKKHLVTNFAFNLIKKYLVFFIFLFKSLHVIMIMIIKESNILAFHAAPQFICLKPAPVFLRPPPSERPLFSDWLDSGNLLRGSPQS